MKKRIYIDVDDVLCQTAKTLLSVLKREFNKVVEYNDIHAFDLQKSFHLSQKDLDHFMKVLHKSDELMKMEIMPHCLEIINNWIKQDYQISIVTGPPVYTIEITKKWLKRNKFQYSDLIFVNKYSKSPPTLNHPNFISLDKLSEQQFTFAIEDSPDMANYLAKNMNLKVALMDRPWNQNQIDKKLEIDGMVVRCKDWKDLQTKFSF